MMKSLARGGGGGLPGMPAIPGTRKGRQAAPPSRKSKSGNPARRAAEEKEAAARAAGARTTAAHNAFGMGGGAAGSAEETADFDPSTLPKGFEKFLGK